MRDTKLIPCCFKGKAIQIELKDENYTRIVVDVEDPEEVLRSLHKK